MSKTLRNALLALLRKLEWSGEGKLYDDGSRAPACPVCRWPQHVGHEDGCELAACVGALEAEEQTVKGLAGGESGYILPENISWFGPAGAAWVCRGALCVPAPGDRHTVKITRTRTGVVARPVPGTIPRVLRATVDLTGDGSLPVENWGDFAFE